VPEARIILPIISKTFRRCIEAEEGISPSARRDTFFKVFDADNIGECGDAQLPGVHRTAGSTAR
jgi:hypothetical protein